MEAGSRARRIATMKPSGTRPRCEPRSAGRPVSVTSIDVFFISGGVTCAADLYRPDGRGRIPAVSGDGARLQRHQGVGAGLRRAVRRGRVGGAGVRLPPFRRERRRAPPARRRGQAARGLPRRGALCPDLPGHRSGADRAVGHLLQRRPRDSRRGRGSPHRRGGGAGAAHRRAADGPHDAGNACGAP